MEIIKELSAEEVSNTIASPSNDILFAMKKILILDNKTISEDDKKEMIRLYNMLEAYFYLPFDDKLRESQHKISSLKYTLELRDNEIKNLERKISAQREALKDSLILKATNDLYHAISSFNSNIR